MEEQVLSVEQMQEFIELGIDTSKASMCWFPKMVLDNNRKPFVESHFLGINHIDCDAYWNTTEGKNTIPTFTLQDILEMLPNEIDGCTKRISIYPINSKNMGLVYYEDTTTYSEQHELTSLGRLGQVTHKILHGEYDKPLLEVAFNMLKWCKINNQL